MKSFIIRLFEWGCLVLLGGLIIEFLLLFQDNEYTYKFQYIHNHRNDIECLILGSSTSNNNINPKYLDISSFNTASSARIIYYDYALLNHFINDMPNLKCVIMTIAPFHLYRDYRYKVKTAEHAAIHEPTYRCMHYKYMNLSYDYKDILYWSEILNSNYNYMDRFSEEYSKRADFDSLGYGKLLGHLEGQKYGNWKEFKVFTDIDYNDPNVEKAVNHNIEFLVNIANLCKNKKLRFILLQTPFHPIARETITMKDKSHLASCIRAIRKNYDKTEYYDFSCDSSFNDDRYYFNASHLNIEGAEKFSHIVNNIVQKGR